MKTLLTRSISGLIFVSVVLLSLLLSKNYLVLLFVAVSGICFYEFHKMFKSDKLLNFNPIISGIIASIGFLITVNHYMPIPIFEFSEDFGKYGLLSMMTLLICIQLLFQAKNAFSNIALILLGTVYILIPLILGAIIHIKDDSGDLPILLFVFLLVWINDTFAYLSGMLFGKHKMAPKISPKKTWEGFIGGLLFTIMAAYLIHLFESNYSMFWVYSAVIIAPAAVLGDLFESYLKRKNKIKDTGNIMPGHGGLLDRFDAMLFAIPFFYIWHVIYTFT